MAIIDLNQMVLLAVAAIVAAGLIGIAANVFLAYLSSQNARASHENLFNLHSMGVNSLVGVSEMRTLDNQLDDRYVVRREEVTVEETDSNAESVRR